MYFENLDALFEKVIFLFNLLRHFFLKFYISLLPLARFIYVLNILCFLHILVPTYK